MSILPSRRPNAADSPELRWHVDEFGPGGRLGYRELVSPQSVQVHLDRAADTPLHLCTRLTRCDAPGEIGNVRRVVSRRALVHDGVFQALASFFRGLLGSLALFFSLGFSAWLGHYCFTQSYRYAPAAFIAPLSYIHLLWAAVLGWLIFGHSPEPLAIAGMSLVALAGILSAVRGRRGKRPAQLASEDGLTEKAG